MDEPCIPMWMLGATAVPRPDISIRIAGRAPCRSHATGVHPREPAVEQVRHCLAVRPLRRRPARLELLAQVRVLVHARIVGRSGCLQRLLRSSRRMPPLPAQPPTRRAAHHMHKEHQHSKRRLLGVPTRVMPCLSDTASKVGYEAAPCCRPLLWVSAGARGARGLTKRRCMTRPPTWSSVPGACAPSMTELDVRC